MFIVFFRAWDKESNLRPWEESNKRPTGFVLRYSASEKPKILWWAWQLPGWNETRALRTIKMSNFVRLVWIIDGWWSREEYDESCFSSREQSWMKILRLLGKHDIQRTFWLRLPRESIEAMSEAPSMEATSSDGKHDKMFPIRTITN